MRKPIPPDELCRLCKGTGRRLRPPHRPNIADPATALKLLQTLSPAQVAARLGVNVCTIYRIRAKAKKVTTS